MGALRGLLGVHEGCDIIANFKSSRNMKILLKHNTTILTISSALLGHKRRKYR
jgi:hypothetical protein